MPMNHITYRRGWTGNGWADSPVEDNFLKHGFIPQILKMFSTQEYWKHLCNLIEAVCLSRLYLFVCLFLNLATLDLLNQLLC